MTDDISYFSDFEILNERQTIRRILSVTLQVPLGSKILVLCISASVKTFISLQEEISQVIDKKQAVM